MFGIRDSGHYFGRVSRLCGLVEFKCEGEGWNGRHGAVQGVGVCREGGRKLEYGAPVQAAFINQRQ
jgi:hypothetical protein